VQATFIVETLPTCEADIIAPIWRRRSMTMIYRL